MPTIQQHLTPYNYSTQRGKIRYIVVHYTSGAKTAEGAAKANCIYFARAKRGASAHYFIDDGDTIWQSVEDHHTAWAVGTNGKYWHSECRNHNSISIEVCTAGAFTEKEIQNLTWLVQKLMKQYGVTADRVIRHRDVTGKQCPAYYVDDARWKTLHARITKGSGEWVSQDGNYWYRYADGSYPKNQWLELDGAWYYFDAAGWLKDGWLKYDDEYYYLEPEHNGHYGAMVTGWRRVGSYWYYFKPNGAMAVGWIHDEGKWYYTDKNGAVYASRLVVVGNEAYAFGTDGAMLTGRFQVTTNERGALVL